jgi:hypothetical protein
MNRSRQLRSRSVGLLLVCTLATAACGSTVQQSGGTALAGGGALADGSTAAAGSDGLGGVAAVPGADSGLDVSAPGSVGLGGAPVVDGASATGGSGGTAASQPGAGGAAQAPAAGSGSAGAAAAGGGDGFVSGPGVTATSIFLGIPYCGDCASANAALGAGGESPNDPRDYYKAALDEVNARGGVLGRKLVPVFHEVSASKNIDASAQEACETFTKDNKVAAMFFRGELSYECAKKAGIIVVGGGASGPVFDRYPNLFAPSGIRLERLGAVTVNAMVKAGWHKPEPKWPTGKIGLITWDNNDYKYAMQKGWLPALRQAGLKETDVRYIAVPQSDKSIADANAAISSAILAFREKGIDHVFISDGAAGIFAGTGLTFLFLNNAKSQQYYPRYGFNSSNSPGWENLPADQQSGMLAVDGLDTEKANDEGIALNPQRERCLAEMRKRNLRVTDGQPTALTALVACETAWFSEAVFKRATRGTTLPSAIAAAESIGTSYRSSLTYGTRLGPGRHDGLSFFRNSRFDDACKCMKYTSKPYEP